MHCCSSSRRAGDSPRPGAPHWDTASAPPRTPQTQCSQDTGEPWRRPIWEHGPGDSHTARHRPERSPGGWSLLSVHSGVRRVPPPQPRVIVARAAGPVGGPRGLLLQRDKGRPPEHRGAVEEGSETCSQRAQAPGERGTGGSGGCDTRRHCCIHMCLCSRQGKPWTQRHLPLMGGG